MINLPFIASGDKIGFQAVVSQGAGAYAANKHSSAGLFGSGNEVAFGWLIDGVYVNGSNVELTNIWSVIGGYEHVWSPNFRTSWFGGYLNVGYNNTATGFFCGAGATQSAVNTFSNCDPDYSLWSVGSRAIGHRSATSSSASKSNICRSIRPLRAPLISPAVLVTAPRHLYREGHRHNVGDGPRSTNLVARGSAPARHEARSLANTCERALASIPQAVPPCPAAPPRPGATCGDGNRDHTLAASRRGADTDRLSHVRRQRPDGDIFVSGGDPCNSIDTACGRSSAVSCSARWPPMRKPRTANPNTGTQRTSLLDPGSHDGRRPGQPQARGLDHHHHGGDQRTGAIRLPGRPRAAGKYASRSAPSATSSTARSRSRFRRAGTPPPT